MSARRQPDRLTTGTFSRLYEEHLDAVFNYCLFRVGDRQLAEDVTAEVFEQAWRDRRRYNPEQASFATWLFAIARHRVVDKQRQLGRRAGVALDGQYEDKAPLPEEQLVREARQARLRDLMQTLPGDHRELIALKFGAGLTNRRIAELLDKSESAVGSAVYRVVQKLRQEWLETEEETDHE